MIKSHRMALVLFILLAPVLLLAQGGRRQHQMQKQNRERIEAHRVAFLTDKLDLSADEAEKFWPVFNAHKEQVEAEQKAFREAHDFEPEDIEAMSEDEAWQFLEAQMAHEQKMLDYRNSFTKELKDILPPQKILMLMDAERDFKMELMRWVSDRRGPGPGGPNR